MRTPGWIARIDRDHVSLSGFVQLADGREVAVHLTDLSSEGCRVHSGEMLAIGGRITVHVPPLEGVKAKVRWSLQGIAGLCFDGDWT